MQTALHTCCIPKKNGNDQFRLRFPFEPPRHTKCGCARSGPENTQHATSVIAIRPRQYCKCTVLSARPPRGSPLLQRSGASARMNMDRPGPDFALRWRNAITVLGMTKIGDEPTRIDGACGGFEFYIRARPDANFDIQTERWKNNCYAAAPVCICM